MKRQREVREAVRRWLVVVLMCAALEGMGCATLERQSGGGEAPGRRAGPSLLQEPEAGVAPEEGGKERLHRRRSVRGWGGEVTLVRGDTVGPSTYGGGEVPEGWTDFSEREGEELLARFLACTSPAEFVELQERVDMPRLVEELDEWQAVRLGAMGPVREDAAHLLQGKRASFLVNTSERYGLAYAEVFALYVLHTAYDDEVEEVLRLLAREKRLGQTLGQMPGVREELEGRGLPLGRYPDRGERAGDVLRGLGRAARDALSTSPTSDGARYTEMTARRGQMPPEYQRALDEVEGELVERHFSAGSVAVGSFDAMTFGVPLGFYYLAVGTGHGAYMLSQGEYEQATRELAPGVMMGALYAVGKGMRGLSRAGGAQGVGRGGAGLAGQRLRALEEMVRGLEERMGVEGLRELAREIRGSREAGRFVAGGGVEAALALREARGDVGRAQAMMARGRPGAGGSSGVGRGAGKGPGGLAALVDEGAGLTREVVEARLALVELESAGPRLRRDVVALEKQRPAVEAPPPGAEGNPRWGEYVAYYEKRLGELKRGMEVEGPLRWAAYERMWGWFARGLAFERLMVEVLRADARLPRGERRFLGDFQKPRIETYVGVWKPGSGLRYVDVLVIETGELVGGPPRVEAFSFKSRDLSSLGDKALEAQMKADAREALWKYGEAVDIRRESLQPLLGEVREVPVPRVRLVYEGGPLMPKDVNEVNRAVLATESAVPGVEVLFQ